MTYASYRAARTGNAVLALALGIVAIAGMVEHHGMELGYNVLILAATAALPGSAAPQSEQTSGNGEDVGRSKGLS